MSGEGERRGRNEGEGEKEEREERERKKRERRRSRERRGRRGRWIVIPDLVVEQQLVKGNPLGVAGTEGGNDVRSLAESRGSIKNLFKSMAFVDLVQEEDGWVQLAESWRKATRNDDIIQKGRDGKKGSHRE